MEAAQHRHQRAKAGAVFAAAGIVAIAPIAPVTSLRGAASTVEQALRLVAGESILNIPFNLFQDFVNIPYYEVQAMNVLADSFFWTGNWFTPSATNIWGEDPGDPGHFMAIMDFLFPFAPQVSGVDQPEIDPTLLANGTAGLGQQLAMLAAAELPVNANCDALECPPMVPVDVLSGFTNLDRGINFLNVFGAGPNQQPMFAHWLQVPLQQLLQGYHFPDGPADTTNPTAAGIVDPDAGVGEGGSVPGANAGGIPGAPGVPNLVPGSEPQPGFGFPGTIDGPNGENLMPWAGVDFKFDPSGPFQQWFTSLQAAPDLNGFQFPSFDDIFQALKALTAGFVIDFNPYVSGSPACPALCDGESPFAPPNGMTTLDLVKEIQNFGPANPLIAQWIDLSESTAPSGVTNAIGMANGATDAQVLAAIAGLQSGMFTFDKDTEDQIIDALIKLDGGHDDLARLVVNSGLLTDPGLVAPWPTTPSIPGETGTLVPPGYNPDLPLDQQQIGEFGGLNQLMVLPDLLKLFGIPVPGAADAADAGGSLSTLSADVGDLFAGI